MAKIWTVPEVYEAIRLEDKEAISDFGGRFPLTTVAITKMNDAAEMFVNAIGDKITVRQLESILKDGINESSASEEVEKKTTDEKPTRRKRRTKAEIEAERAKETKAEPDTNEYNNMTAQELFKLCKKNGIDAVPKKSIQYYIDLLDASEEETEDSSEDDWDEVETKNTSVSKEEQTKEVETDEDEWDI